MTISQMRIEVLSGLTVAIALVPEAISFALIVGVAPQVGLWAAFFMALSCAVFGGRPGLISGATGATAVILAGAVTKFGMDSLATTVILAGILQLIIWATSAWKLFRLIPKTAISGFLIALAILILGGQLRYVTLGNPEHFKLLTVVGVALLSMTAMLLSSKYLKMPPALAAIIVGSLIGIPLGIATVGDLSIVSGSFPIPSLPKLDWAVILGVLPFSFGIAVAGLTESLLTVDVVSHKLNEHGDKGKETMAQGIGNTVSGLFGTIGGCVLVGQTNLNVSAGAKHRLSGLVAAGGLALTILFFAKYIEMIPLAGLIGVMLVVVYQTGDWRSLKTSSVLHLAVLLSTIAVSLITHNLALGILAGTLVFYSEKAVAYVQTRSENRY